MSDRVYCVPFWPVSSTSSVQRMLRDAQLSIVLIKKNWNRVDLCLFMCLFWQCADMLSLWIEVSLVSQNCFAVPPILELIERLIQEATTFMMAYSSLFFRHFDTAFFFPPLKILCTAYSSDDSVALWKDGSSKMLLSRKLILSLHVLIYVESYSLFWIWTASAEWRWINLKNHTSDSHWLSHTYMKHQHIFFSTAYPNIFDAFSKSKLPLG